MNLISIQTEAQTFLSEQEIVGTWRVLQVTHNLPEPPEKEKLELILNAFSKAVFHFKADHYFTFEFEIEEMALANMHWKYNPNSKTFIIQEWQDKDTDKYLQMEILAKKEGARVYFIMEEMFFVLEVKKVE